MSQCTPSATIKKKGIHTINGVLFSHKEERNFVICRYIDGTVDHHVKQSKPGSKSQRLHVSPHMWKLDLQVRCIYYI
jgi:hypothetical protein